MPYTTTHTKLDILNSALRLVGSPELSENDTTSVAYTTTNGALRDAAFAIFGTNVFQYNTRRVFLTGNDVNAPGYSSNTPPDNSTAGYIHQEGSPLPSVFGYMYDLPEEFNLLLKVTSKDGKHILDYQFAGTTSVAGGVDAAGESYIAYLSSSPRLFTTEAEIQLFYTYIPDLLKDNLAIRDYETFKESGSNVTRIPDFLYETITLYVAQAICLQLTGSEQRAMALYDRYVRALRRAKVLEGRSSPAMDYINEANSRLLDSHRGYGKV